MLLLIEWAAIVSLWISLLWSFFCLAVVLGNGSTYDCNLSTVAFAGTFASIPALMNAGVALIAKLLQGKPWKTLATVTGISVAAPLAIGIDAHIYNTPDNCQEQTEEPSSPDVAERVKRLFPAAQPDLRGYAVRTKNGMTYLTFEDDNNGSPCTVDGKDWTYKRGEFGAIEPGRHQVNCDTGGPLEIEIKSGTVFHFNYWGP